MGFGAVEAKLPSVANKDIGTILKTVGMTLISTVGGAGGPLYGTFFMRAGAAVAGKTELSAADFLAALDAGLDGVQQRGKATHRREDDGRCPDTGRDAMRAAVDERQQHRRGAAALRRRPPKQGMKATIPMLATKGRASYLGERSIGHQDPGATSSYLMLKCAADTWSKL